MLRHDGDDLHLLKSEGETFKTIFTGNGSSGDADLHNGVHDIAVGGPGF
ncbi:MAG: hypothetical protein U1E87_08845 [Alphaproteobacteria bacterium]